MKCLKIDLKLTFLYRTNRVVKKFLRLKIDGDASNRKKKFGQIFFYLRCRIVSHPPNSVPVQQKSDFSVAEKEPKNWKAAVVRLIKFAGGMRKLDCDQSL